LIINPSKEQSLVMVKYNNLVAGLHAEESLAQLTNHPASNDNLPEKVTRLHAIVTQALVEEKAVKQVKMIIDCAEMLDATQPLSTHVRYFLINRKQSLKKRQQDLQMIWQRWPLCQI
jgi:hypothetical protein